MITAKEMKRLEALSEKCGVSMLMLMERAGRAVADFISEWVELLKPKIKGLTNEGNKNNKRI